ncbi:MAG: phospholipase A [Dysgonomonas sp.]|nr:phospholipase A [Dysgonomonas sp.]
MKKIRAISFSILFLLISQQIHAQTGNLNDSIMQIVEKEIQTIPFYAKHQFEVNEDDVVKVVDSWPAFGVYEDTFFTTGIPLNKAITRETADVMFQISIRHRITKSHLPFNTFLYLTYTQKSFWDVYAESAPFRDTNYNPSIGLGKYIIHNNKLMGAAFAQIEHESNGRDGEDSRSWNMITLSNKYFFNPRLALELKVWIPFVDGGENKDLLDYRGLGTTSVNYITKNRLLWLTAELNPRKGWGNINTTLTVSYKISSKANQYLYARFYNGKGDSLLDYNKYDMNIRFGFCIKPDFNTIF